MANHSSEDIPSTANSSKVERRRLRAKWWLKESCGKYHVSTQNGALKNPKGVPFQYVVSVGITKKNNDQGNCQSVKVKIPPNKLTSRPAHHVTFARVNVQVFGLLQRCTCASAGEFQVRVPLRDELNYAIHLSFR